MRWVPNAKEILWACNRWCSDDNNDYESTYDDINDYDYNDNVYDDIDGDDDEDNSHEDDDDREW